SCITMSCISTGKLSYNPLLVDEDWEHKKLFTLQEQINHKLPEWDPCRERVCINYDCGRGYPSLSYMRKRLKPPRVRLASSGSRQCYLGLSSGLAIGLVGPGAYCNNTAQAQRPGDRNLAEREVKLLKMTEGRTVPLNPPVVAASGGSGDNVDKMFDEGYDANQEHLVERDDDVLEEVVALDASGGRLPTLTPPNGGKSLSALREMIPEGSAIPSDVMGPLSTASATTVSDVGPVDSVSELNLQTCPPHERSVVDVPVVTIAVTTTDDANVATGSKAKDVPKGFEHIGDSASVGRIEADADRLAPALFYTVSAMDYDHLYSEFNVGSTRQSINVLEAADAAKGVELRDLKEKEFALEGEKNVLSKRVEALESAAASKEGLSCHSEEFTELLVQSLGSD
ncbi:hypothetical protein Tco_0848231, partial [Tanacetum coccineum]